MVRRTSAEHSARQALVMILLRSLYAVSHRYLVGLQYSAAHRRL